VFLAILNFEESPLLGYQGQKNLQMASQLLQSGRLDDDVNIIAICCKAMNGKGG